MSITKEYADVPVGFDDSEKHNFPQCIKRVTGEEGGDAFLIFGSEKVALYDCGMAYGADKTIANIERELGDRKLDYILLSHTHYDHLGALPQIKKRWPDAIVVGSGYAAYVLTRDGAKRTMKRLGEEAIEFYKPENPSEVLTDGFGVDKVVDDGDKISLGDKEVVVMVTKGHTKCSLSYGIEPDKILFASESTGVIGEEQKVVPSVLIGYKETMDSLKKCRDYGANTVILQHYGNVPGKDAPKYWDAFERAVNEERELITALYDEGKTPEEILKEYRKYYWTENRSEAEPPAAFDENVLATIALYASERG